MSYKVNKRRTYKINIQISYKIHNRTISMIIYIIAIVKCMILISMIGVLL